MSSLVIIGNGFDIAHGLPTKYSDFKKYLCKLDHEPEEIYPGFISTVGFSDNDKEKRRLFEDMQKYIDADNLWSSLESALGDLDYSQLEEDYSNSLIPYGSDDWRDSAHHDYQFMIGEELDFASLIPKQFSCWVDSISLSQTQKFCTDVINSDNLFLCFNYTDTLEKTYNIPEHRICYIHGKASRGDALVLGHHDDSYFKLEPKPGLSFAELMEDFEYRNSADLRIQEAQEIISRYFKSTYKDTKSIINKHFLFFSQLSNITSIHVLGHSLSIIDFDYFNEVCKTVSNNCQWIIYCFSDEDFKNANKLAQTLRIENRCKLVNIADYYI